MKAQLEGKICRIYLDSTQGVVSFILEGDNAIHRLQCGSHQGRESAHVLGLSQAGDTVALSYWERKSRVSEGSLVSWENKTLGLTSAVPADLL